jgi:hypothetical protein
MTKKKEVYPGRIYVVRDYSGEGNESYLVAQEDPKDVADLYSKREVAIYALVRLAEVETKVEIR